MEGSPIDLPAELQVEIAKFADNDSLLALRQVNRELAANCLEEFGQRFFACRRHVLTGHSLEVLRNITATPYLVRHLRILEIFALRLNLEHDKYSDTPGTFPVEDTLRPWHRDFDDAVGWENTTVLDDVFQNLTGTRIHFLSLFGTPLWVRDTKDLPPLDAVTSDEVCAAHGNTFGVASYARSVQKWSQETSLLKSTCSVYVVEAVYRSLFRSTFRPRAIVIHETSIHPGWMDRLSPTELSGFREFCSRIEHLTFNMQRGLGPFALGIFFALTNLASITILEADTFLLAMALNTVPSRKLEKLAVAKTSGGYEFLASALLSHAKTLKSLALEGMDLRDGGWQGVFEMLSRDFSLTDLYLDRLQEGPRGFMADSQGRIGPWCFQGEEEVRNLLAQAGS